MRGSPPGGTIVRFSRAERVSHWALAVPYVLLFTSGALLLIERLAGLTLVPATLLAEVHLVCGFVLPLVFLLGLIASDSGVMWQNTRAALSWGRADLRWLLVTPLRLLLPRLAPPPAGRFNAGQKLHQLAQLLLVPVLLASGLLMWLEPAMLLPWYVHVACFGLIIPLVFGHVYLALFHPTTRRGLFGILTGRVDAEWAREHHPLEYARGKDGDA